MPENVKFNIHCIYSLFEECRPYVLISNVVASIRKEKIESEKVPQCTHLTEGEGGGSKAILAMPIKIHIHSYYFSKRVFPKTAEYFNEVQPTNIL